MKFIVLQLNFYLIGKSDGFKCQLHIKFCNNIWAKLEIRWNRNTKISREATESELSKLMMVRVAFCSALVFCYLVNKSLKISLECAPPVINFQREERTKANVTLILQCSVELFHHSIFGDNEIGIVKGTKVSHDFDLICHRIGPMARTYLQLPLQQWGAGNVYLLVLFS